MLANEGRIFESAVGALLAQVPLTKLYYWREDKYEVDFVLESEKGLFAIEVKSNSKKGGRGLAMFSGYKSEMDVCKTNFYSIAIGFKMPDA